MGKGSKPKETQAQEVFHVGMLQLRGQACQIVL